MQRIITLLEQKNHYLEKFYSLNETEVINFAKGNFDNLEHFYQTREKILELIKYLDIEVDKAQAAFSGTVQNDDKQRVKEALAIKEEYVTRILAQDLEILSCIETTKSGIIRELQEIQKAKRAMGQYKSKKFTTRLDEEV